MKNKLISNSLNLTLLDANLYGGVTFQQEVITGNDFVYGVVAAASIKFSIDNTNNEAETYIDQAFDWYCQMSGEADYAYKGTYTVTDITKNGKKATLTAYDCIKKLDTSADAWVSTLKYPITLANMLSSMGNKLGLSITALTNTYRGNYTVYNNFMTRNITYRQILGYIAQIANVNFMADISGQKDIIYKRYTETATTIDNSKYVKLTLSDYTTEPIDKVQIQSTFDDIGYVVGTGNNAYVITENPLFFTNEKQSTITSIASSLLAELKTITYTPMKFSTLKDFDINCGDIIKVNNISCYIMKKSIKPSGCEFECVGNKRRDTQKTEVNSAITALNNKTNELIRTVDETKSTLTEVRGSLKTVTDEQGEIKKQIATITTDVSEVKQTAQGLTSKVSSVETTLNNLDGEVTILKTKQSTIEQNVNSITTRVEVAEGTANEAKTMASEAKQTANSFSTKITEVEKTADSAKTTASEAKQTANSFSTRITEAEETANGAATTASEAKQTANSFSTRITTAEGNISSLTQTAGKIDWLIKSGTSSTNFTLTDRTISLISSSINLTGYVTIKSLGSGGTTVVDGGRITTGTIDASKVAVKNLNASNITSGTIDASKITVTNIDASKITSGTISADRIDTDKLYVDRLYCNSGFKKCVIDCHNTDIIYIGGENNSNSVNYVYMKANSAAYIGSWGSNSAQFVFNMGSSISFYSSSGTIASLGTYSQPWGDIYFSEFTVRIANNTKLSGAISGNTYIITPNNCQLGTSTAAFAAGYFTKLYVGGKEIKPNSGGSTVTVSKLTSGSYSVSLSSNTLAPARDNTYNLGSSSYYWSNVYAYALWLKSGYNTVKLTCYASGELAINGRKATHA